MKTFSLTVQFLRHMNVSSLSRWLCMLNKLTHSFHKVWIDERFVISVLWQNNSLATGTHQEIIRPTAQSQTSDHESCMYNLNICLPLSLHGAGADSVWSMWELEYNQQFIRVWTHWSKAQSRGRLHNFGGLNPQNNQGLAPSVVCCYKTGQGRATNNMHELNQNTGRCSTRFITPRNSICAFICNSLFSFFLWLKHGQRHDFPGGVNAGFSQSPLYLLVDYLV